MSSESKQRKVLILDKAIMGDYVTLFQYGVGAIPDTWKEKTLRYQENISLTQQLCRIATESKEIMKLAPRDS